MAYEQKTLPKFLGRTFLAEQISRIKPVEITELKPYEKALRHHSDAQTNAMMGNLERFGQILPIPVTADHVIIDGHLVIEALKKLNASHALVIHVEHLSVAEIKAIRVGLNKLGEATTWDEELLVLELTEIIDAGIDLDILGSDFIELDVLSENLRTDGPDKDDAAPVFPPDYQPTTKLGDLWVLGDHRLLCGDATKLEPYRKLLGSDSVQMVFTDPPYNVKINGHVKRNSDAHREFVMASGEMTASQFVEFLHAHMDCLTFGIRYEAKSLVARYANMAPEQIFLKAGVSQIYQRYGKIENFDELRADEYKKWSFWTYAHRAERVMRGFDNRILSQVGQHKKKVMSLLRGEIEKACAKKTSQVLPKNA